MIGLNAKEKTNLNVNVKKLRASCGMWVVTSTDEILYIGSWLLLENSGHYKLQLWNWTCYKAWALVGHRAVMIILPIRLLHEQGVELIQLYS